MRLGHLKVFVSVYENMGVTAAARKLNISQPPVSRMLRSFEQKTGLELFRRESGRLFPTPEADSLYLEAINVLEQIDQFNKSADDLRAGRSRALVLSGALPLGHVLFPSVLKHIRKRYPEWPLHVRTAELSDQMAAITKGNIDISVTFGEAKISGIQSIELGESKLQLVTHKDHPFAGLKSVSLYDLQDNEVISGPPESPLRIALDQVTGPAENICSQTIVSRSVTLTIRMVSEGMGVAIVDPFSVAAFADTNISIVQLNEYIPFKIQALIKSGRILSSKEIELIQSIKATTQRYIAKNVV